MRSLQTGGERGFHSQPCEPDSGLAGSGSQSIHQPQLCSATTSPATAHRWPIRRVFVTSSWCLHQLESSVLMTLSKLRPVRGWVHDGHCLR
ncbi:hypothetical protein E2C01_016166 [Portunus trituberculatus]|uniref:Uncharacterized protein n=1 Tax=Portunus trituberculatus TaxID=210409 RepID=A0A5B7DPU2_PORTR|nr:hypothetical protein [Portunus trituberculatus]